MFDGTDGARDTFKDLGEVTGAASIGRAIIVSACRIVAEGRKGDMMIRSRISEVRQPDVSHCCRPCNGVMGFGTYE